MNVCTGKEGFKIGKLYSILATIIKIKVFATLLGLRCIINRCLLRKFDAKLDFKDSFGGIYFTQKHSISRTAVV